MATVVSAFRMNDGIQLNEHVDGDILRSRMVMPEDSDWLYALSHLPGNTDDGVARIAGQPEDVINTARHIAATRIAVVVSDVRSAFTTDIRDQSLVYTLKEEEARAWLSAPGAPLEDFPFLQAEVGISVDTADELAEIWLEKAKTRKRALARIEQIRMLSINAVRQIDDIRQIDDTVAWALSELQAVRTAHAT